MESLSAHPLQKLVNAIASGHHTRHHEEEKSSLEAWLTKIRNESTGNRGPLTAEYRLALENLDLIPNGDTQTLPADHQVMLIDRLVLRFSKPAGGIEIHNTRTGKVVGKATTGKPVRLGQAQRSEDSPSGSFRCLPQKANS